MKITDANVIPLSACDVTEFVPTFFAADNKENPPTFIIRVPTFQIRDKMAAILFQRGLIPTTVAMGRAILIDALYDLYDEAKADETAEFLEQYWTKAEVHDELLNGWSIREANRIFDQTIGLRKGVEQEPIPTAPFSMRDQARQARIMADALQRHEEFRSYQARFVVQQAEEEEMVVRLFLLDWKNCVTREGQGAPVVEKIVAERDDMDRLTPESIEGIRRWLFDQGAENAWAEIVRAIKAPFGKHGGLEKNFDSLLDSNSSRTGFPTSSGDLESKSGSSTTSSTEPTPSTASPATSASSRNSRSSSARSRKPASRKRGRTAARS